MNKLGFALLLFTAIEIGMVGTLTESQVRLHPVYAQKPPNPLGSCPDGHEPAGVVSGM
ncbi:MAG: hypothetical protein WA364_17865 [Candidatus Nitrosopolaris sp.]